MDVEKQDVSSTKRTAWIVLWVAIVIVLLADVAWLIMKRDPADSRAQTEIEPAQETTAPVMPSVVPTPSGEPTSAGQTTDGGSTAATSSTGSTPGQRRAGRIAYRLGATVYVADEDGQNPSPVIRATEGPFALAPDGRTLAIVQDGSLVLVDTETGHSTSVGEAVDEALVWTPDSAAVLFVRRAGQSHEVRRVRRDGTKDTMLRQGTAMSVSPGGRTIAVFEGGIASSGGYVWVSRDGGAFRRIKVVTGTVTGVAAGDDRVYTAVVADGDEPDSRIVSVGLDGTHITRLAGAPAGEVPAAWATLALSPDGSTLAGSALGDDGYSRISLFALPGGAESRLALRRDGYVRFWSPSGAYLFYVEGNAFQGEPTVLYRVGPDGMGRRVVATGAR